MLTPKEVKDQGFPTRHKGYDMDAVDEFLDSLTEDYTKLYNSYGKLYTAYNKLSRKAQEQSEAYERLRVQSPAENTQQIFLSAHKDADAIRAAAETERVRIIDEATNYAYSNADRLKSEYAQLQAEVEAAKAERDRIQMEAAGEAARLDSLKSELADAQGRMDALTQAAGEYLYRFRALQRYAADSAEHLSSLLDAHAAQKAAEEAQTAEPEQAGTTAAEPEEDIFSEAEAGEADNGEPAVEEAVEVPEEMPFEDEADDGEPEALTEDIQ